MNLPQIVALQSLLYAILWLVVSLWWRQARGATLVWMGYALAACIAFFLIGWRPDGPVWLTHSLASGMHFLGLALARLGVEIFLKIKPRWLEYVAYLVVGVLGLVWIGPLHEAARIALTSVLSALVLGGAGLSIWTPLQQQFGRRFAVAAAIPVVFLIVINVSLGLGALRGLDETVPVTAPNPGAVWSLTLASAAVFNFLFVFLLGMRMQRNLERMATHDVLTGLLNRRGMQSLLQTQWNNFKRNGVPFAVIALDIDHFKRVNDSLGHDAGDKVLVALGELLSREVRGTDQAARMGGEEFLVLMPGCQAQSHGLLLAQRLREALAAMPVDLGQGAPLYVTASWGVAGLHPLSAAQHRLGLQEANAPDNSVQEVLRQADVALYEGKRNGRDRVMLFEGQTSVPPDRME